MPGSSTISRGNVLNTIVLQVNLTPVAVAANSTVEQSFTIPGLIAGDQVSAFILQAAYPNTDVSYVNARCAANNTLTVAYQNGTGGSLTPPSGNYYIEINRLENLPPPANLV